MKNFIVCKKKNIIFIQRMKVYIQFYGKSAKADGS